MKTTFKASEKTETYTKLIKVREKEDGILSADSMAVVISSCRLTGETSREVFWGDNFEAKAKAYYKSINKGPEPRVYEYTGMTMGDYADMYERMDGQL